MNPQQPYPEQPYPQQPYSQQYPQQGYPQQPYPQSPYPYAQQPYPPQQPPKPSGSVTISRNALIIIGVVVVVAVVAFLAVRPGGFLNPGNSLTGSWYGQLTLNGGFQQETYEAFGTLTQSGSTLTGTAELCLNIQGNARVEPGVSLNGTADGSNLTLTVSAGGQSTPVHGTYSASAGTASGSWTTADSQGSWTLSFQSGTDSQFRSACASLPSRG